MQINVSYTFNRFSIFYEITFIIFVVILGKDKVLKTI